MKTFTGCKLPKTFSDAWVKEFTKALACPTFKFTRAKEPKLTVCATEKEKINLNYILNLTKE